MAIVRAAFAQQGGERGIVVERAALGEVGRDDAAEFRVFWNTSPAPWGPWQPLQPTRVATRRPSTGSPAGGTGADTAGGDGGARLHATNDRHSRTSDAMRMDDSPPRR